MYYALLIKLRDQYDIYPPANNINVHTYIINKISENQPSLKRILNNMREYRRKADYDTHITIYSNYVKAQRDYFNKVVDLLHLAV